MKAPERIPHRVGARPGWLAAGVAASLALHGAVVAGLLLWPAARKPEPETQGAVAMVFADVVDPGGAAADEEAPPPAPAVATAPAMPAPEAAEPLPPPVAAPAPTPPAPAPPPTVAEPIPALPVPAVIPAPEPPAVAAQAAPASPAPPPEPPAEPPLAAAPDDGTLPPPPVAAQEAPRPAALAEASEATPPPPEPAPPPAQATDPAPPATQMAAAATPAPPEPPRAQPAAAPRPPRPARPPAPPGPMRLDAGIGALPDPSFGARAMGAVVPPGTDAGQRNAPPDYPAESRRRGEEGVVRLSLRVGIDGQVEAAEVSVSSGFPRLDSAAVEAARRWRFRPATQGGLPVAATLPTAVHFRLTDARGR